MGNRNSSKESLSVNSISFNKISIDQNNGPIKTLEQALEIAEEGTIIKMCEGVYLCNAVVSKPGIKIQPRDKDKPVYLLG
jgi:hypothetical protein